MKAQLKKVIWKLYVKLLPTRNDKLYSDSLRLFRKKIMDPSFDWKKYAKDMNPYYAKYGFKFSTVESKYYKECTGVESDLYLPIAFYNKCLYPFLNPDSWRMGYCDKNMFPRLLNIKEAQEHVDILIPEYVAYCDNGRFFVNEDRLCTKEEAIKEVIDFGEDFIIKPTIDSSHGSGITKVEASNINEEYLEKLFAEYGDNFTIQKLIKQHPDLAAYNPTSVNTIRITTYQDFNGNVKVLYASQRFGGKGKVYDNADDPNGSGGFCPINADGTVKREVHRYRNLKVTPLDESVPGVTPCFEKVIEAVKFLHTRFPQFALIGWDMTVTTDGHPLVIEYNFFPGLGTGQIAHGPIFSKEDLDEIMSRIKKSRFVYTPKAQTEFVGRPGHTILKRV